MLDSDTDTRLSVFCLRFIVIIRIVCCWSLAAIFVLFFDAVRRTYTSPVRRRTKLHDKINASTDFIANSIRGLTWRQMMRVHPHWPVLKCCWDHFRFLGCRYLASRHSAASVREILCDSYLLLATRKHRVMSVLLFISILWARIANFQWRQIWIKWSRKQFGGLVCKRGFRVLKFIIRFELFLTVYSFCNLQYCIR